MSKEDLETIEIDLKHTDDEIDDVGSPTESDQEFIVDESDIEDDDEEMEYEGNVVFQNCTIFIYEK